jgi:hypothetical protein
LGSTNQEKLFMKRFFLSALLAAGLVVVGAVAVSAQPYQAGSGAYIGPGGSSAYGFASGGWSSSAYSASGPGYAYGGGFTYGPYGSAGANSAAIWTPYGPMGQSFGSTTGWGGSSQTFTYSNPYGAGGHSYSFVPGPRYYYGR